MACDGVRDGSMVRNRPGGLGLRKDVYVCMCCSPNHVIR